MRDFFSIGAKRWPGVSKLIEEAGELLQLLGKFMQTPDGDHWDNSLYPLSLKERLQNEMADLAAAIEFVIRHGEFDVAALSKRKGEKLAKFELWHVYDNEVIK